MCLTSVLILFWSTRLTGGKYASVFIFMDRFHSMCSFPLDDLHFGKLPVFHFVKMFSYVILSLISVVGGGAEFLAGGREGGPVLGF